MGDSESKVSVETHTVDEAAEDSDSGKFDTITVECYRRREKILSGTHHTEWWMAIAVLLVTAGFAFVIL